MKTYQGTNPKPADVDEFWDKGIRLALGTDPDVKLEAAQFRSTGCDCYHLWFQGVDGARIHAKYLRPANADGPCPVVFIFHGYTGQSGDWFDKLPWVQKGYAVVAMDCRGQAGQSQDLGNVGGSTYMGHIIRGLRDGADRLLYRYIFLDTVVLVNAVKQFEEIDETRMAVHGGSQGGALSLVCAALNPQIRKAAVLYPFLCDYQRVWELDCTGSAYEELRLFFRYHDPRHEMREEYFTRLGYIDVQYLVHRIKADVLWATALKDQACPASTQFAAYNKLNTNKQMIIYPDFGHEFLPDFMDKSYEFISF